MAGEIRLALNNATEPWRGLPGNVRFWQTEPDAMQGGRCAAVRAAANTAAHRFWTPKCAFIFWRVLGAAGPGGERPGHFFSF